MLLAAPLLLLPGPCAVVVVVVAAAAAVDDEDGAEGACEREKVRMSEQEGSRLCSGSTSAAPGKDTNSLSLPPSLSLPLSMFRASTDTARGGREQTDRRTNERANAQTKALKRQRQIELLLRDVKSFENEQQRRRLMLELRAAG